MQFCKSNSSGLAIEMELSMNQKIIEAFSKNLSGDLKQIIISNTTDAVKGTKVKIRPVLLKKALMFQATEYIGTKVFHQNYTADELTAKLSDWFEGLYRQVEIKSMTSQTNILISKKGAVTVKTKKDAVQVIPAFQVSEHDRKKQYILKEGVAVPFLQDLGIMSADGNIIRSKYDKFKQINRYLEFIEDILPNFDKQQEVRIVDFGCGKSYLTFAMYYYLHEMMGYQIKVTGLDLKEDVIRTCNELKERYGYENLEFLQGDIADYDGTDHVDMVVTLHACDTATDYALYKASKWGAKVILSVPCCQHELNKQISCEPLADILKYGLIKERMSALMTDALRGNILETLGYKVQILEFIDMEHTPKNILLRAVKNTKPVSEAKKKEALDRLKGSLSFLNADLTLLGLLNEDTH